MAIGPSYGTIRLGASSTLLDFCTDREREELAFFQTEEPLERAARADCCQSGVKASNGLEGGGAGAGDGEGVVEAKGSNWLAIVLCEVK